LLKLLSTPSSMYRYQVVRAVSAGAEKVARWDHSPLRDKAGVIGYQSLLGVSGAPIVGVLWNKLDRFRRSR
jgi:hypothetical protein